MTTPDIIPIPADTRTEHRAGPFHIWRSYPGRFLPRSRDTGLGPLGCVDHAVLLPGLRVPMHTHRDDEIFSYLRAGTLVHTDSLGQSLRLDPRHPLMMNAGAGLAHEEEVPPEADRTHMLQIFVRPTAAGLPPTLQHVTLPEAESPNRWRLLAGPPDTGAPFHFRNAVVLHDVTLTDSSIAAPAATPDEWRWLYVFDGQVACGALKLSRGDALLLRSDAEAILHTATSARLVCFRCDLTAPFTRAGTLSG